MENKIESVKINQFGHEVGCLKLQAIVVKTALHPSCESKAHLLQVWPLLQHCIPPLRRTLLDTCGSLQYCFPPLRGTLLDTCGSLQYCFPPLTRGTLLDTCGPLQYSFPPLTRGTLLDTCGSLQYCFPPLTRGSLLDTCGSRHPTSSQCLRENHCKVSVEQHMSCGPKL